MSYKKIMRMFSITLAVSVLLRIVQSMFLVEPKTGFIAANLKTINIAIVAVIAVLMLLTAVFSYKTRRSFEKPPKVKFSLAIICFAMVAVCAIDMITLVGSSLRSFYPMWEILIIFAGGVLAVLFFSLYGMKAFTKIKLPDLAYIIPLVYTTVRLIRIFAQTSYISVIMDNLFLIFAGASSVLFGLEFVRINNGFTAQDDCRRLLCIGNINTILCFCASIPCLINYLINGLSFVHSDLLMILSILIFGLFSFSFNINFFKGSRKNHSDNHHHHHHHHHHHSEESASQLGKPTNEFYSGDGKS